MPNYLIQIENYIIFNIFQFYMEHYQNNSQVKPVICFSIRNLYFYVNLPSDKWPGSL
jgi:hypothetical protein